MDFDKVKEKFIHHPENNGMSYTEHLQHAWTLGFKSIGAGLVLVTHGIFPFVFEKDGTNILKDVVEDINKNEKKS